MGFSRAGSECPYAVCRAVMRGAPPRLYNEPYLTASAPPPKEWPRARRTATWYMYNQFHQAYEASGFVLRVDLEAPPPTHRWVLVDCRVHVAEDPFVVRGSDHSMCECEL